MKASESWQAILPEMSLRIYPRVKTLAINKSRVSRIVVIVLQRRKVRIIWKESARYTSANQPWTRLIWISNFRLLSAFIVPVTLSRDNPRKKFEPIILEVTVTCCHCPVSITVTALVSSQNNSSYFPLEIPRLVMIKLTWNMFCFLQSTAYCAGPDSMPNHLPEKLYSWLHLI